MSPTAIAGSPNAELRAADASGRFDPQRLRRDFPMLTARVNGRPLIYLDNAATTQKPQSVIDRLNRFYCEEYAKNDEEHTLSKAVTKNIEAARKAVGALLGAPLAEQIVFARNATDALHIIANGLAESILGPNDEILLTELEHHSNIVPWLIAAKRTGARLVVSPITDAGDIDLDAMRERLSSRTRVVAVSHVSHVLGTVTPVQDICALARANQSITVIDGAQATPHVPVDVAAIGCDFYVGCGHKTYGPTSVGFFFGTEARLAALPPLEGGSDNTAEVSFEGWSAKPPPQRFQAGTPAIADQLGLETALRYVTAIGLKAIKTYEEDLDSYLGDRLRSLAGVRVLGRPREKVCLTSFVVEELQTQKALSSFLDAEFGIAVRAGPLSAQPLMVRLGIKEAVRASLALYSTRDEVDLLIEGVARFVKTAG